MRVTYGTKMWNQVGRRWFPPGGFETAPLPGRHTREEGGYVSQQHPAEGGQPARGKAEKRLTCEHAHTHTIKLL